MNSKPYTCCQGPDGFWTPQVGYGILPDGRVYFSGVRRQKGAGLGGVFGAIARRLLPFAKQFILPHAKTALQGLASDLTDPNTSFKQSLKKHGVAALKDIGRDVLNQTGRGRGRVSKSSRRARYRGRKIQKKKVNNKSKRKPGATKKKNLKDKSLRYLF